MEKAIRKHTSLSSSRVLLAVHRQLASICIGTIERGDVLSAKASVFSAKSDLATFNSSVTERMFNKRRFVHLLNFPYLRIFLSSPSSVTNVPYLSGNLVRKVVSSPQSVCPRTPALKLPVCCQELRHISANITDNPL